MQLLKATVPFVLIPVLFFQCKKNVEREPESPITQELIKWAQAHLNFLEGYHSVEYNHDFNTDTWGLVYRATYNREPPGEEEKAKYWDARFAMIARYAFFEVLKGKWGKWTEISYTVHFLRNEFGPGGDYIIYTYKKDDPVFK
jgi:hypothetical protein